MSAGEQAGSFGRAPKVGRLLTDQERLARMADETASYIEAEQLRTAFAISGAYVVTAWHCVAGRFDERIWFRLRQPAVEGPRYAYIPLRVANFSSSLDIVVLALDEPSLPAAQLAENIAAEMLRAASIPLSPRVQVGDQVRIMGFPASAASADSDSNAATIVDLELSIGSSTAVKLYGDAFAAVDPVNPRGLSGGPVLRRDARAGGLPGQEAAVAIIRAVPRGMYPHTASGGGLIATHIADAAAELPEIAGLLPAAGSARRDRPRAGSGPAQRRAVAPRQLPPPIAHFTGRQAGLDYLNRLLADDQRRIKRTAVISAIDGTAGVGKTALAIQWAHSVRDQFPDGDLYVNLHGYDFPTPADAQDVMDYFLRALGIPPAEIPREADARTSLYRSVLYERSVLLVLDNAASVEQVAPLLPTSEHSLALITSRSRLPGLAATHATAQVSIDLMTHAEAMELLAEIIGADRVHDEEAAARRLAEQCAHLPLALRIVAENIKVRPRARLATISADLGGASALDNFTTPDESLAVEKVFGWSYQRLSDGDATLFRRLSLHPGAEISAESAAALVLQPIPAAVRPLNRLANVHMVEEVSDRRFTFHDLLRLYAEEKCLADDTDEARSASFENLASWYVHTANNANKLLMQRAPIDVRSPLTGTAPLAFGDFADALAWCEAERENFALLTAKAYKAGLLDIACKLPDVLRGFYNLRKHWSDWEMTHGIALKAATQLADPYVEASLLNGMGTLLKQTNRSAGAVDYHQAALARRRMLGDHVGVASSLDGLGTALRDVDRANDALACFRESLAIRESQGDRKGQGWSFNNLGETEHQLGNHEEALRLFTLALTARTEVGDQWGQGRTLHGLGAAYDALDNPLEAKAQYQAAVAVRLAISDRWGVAWSLDAWGDTEQRLGNLAEARRLWSEALTMLTELGDAHGDAVAAKLAALLG